MSGFEFVLVLYAIIVGLGISDILAGWGEQIRARDRVEVYPLQIALSFVLMVYGITYLWAMWTFRDTAWTFNLYAAFAVIPLVISLASRVIRQDTAVGAATPREQYLGNARPVFLLLSVVPVMLILMSLQPTVRESIPDPPNLVAITLLRVMVMFAMLYLAWSRSERVHWVGIVALFIIVLALSSRLTERAIEGGV